VDDLFYDFTADELGIDPKTAAKIQEIKRLRPLSPKQPWGIFFVKFEPKKLPVVALRRILSQVALKKRASANSAERAAWAADDLLFVSNYGEGNERQISFAHFSRAQGGHDLPTLKVLGWDNRDTALHLDAVARELTEHLAWPDDDSNAESWRTRWRAAFTLRHREVVTTSKELSIRLAELARNIRDRIRTALAIETDKGPLTRLMKAFQEALVHDLDADGFADMYAQTIAYGLLSARIADPHKKTADDFAAHMRTNPFLRELMETFLKVGGRRGKAGGPGIDFDELGVSEVVDLLDDANMEAVVRDFGDRNRQEDPVIHFYELFLKEYDARKRMQRGVFYTPRPIVAYIVRSVDELLRTDFGLADGLADTTTWGEMAKCHMDLKIPDGVSPDQDFVQILDPATGTGTFLVEVIDLIHKTLVAKWKALVHGEKKIDALWNEYVPKHLLPRLHGYELLMAPYAIAHLKIGLKLYETGYRFGSDERARVYLTNALEPAHDFSGTFAFAIPALAHEAAAVNEIKRHNRFTVVIGNPPYSVTSANFNSFIDALMDDYKKHVRGEQGLVALADDYLKFVRLSQEILSAPNCGVWGMITNHGYLKGVIHRGVRLELLDQFNAMFILDLHGDSNIGERVPAGRGNENVFDIQQGVAVSIGVCPLGKQSASSVRHSDLWGSRNEKYEDLASHPISRRKWTDLRPVEPRYFLIPFDDANLAEYEDFPSLNELMAVNSCGVKTHRDGVVIDFDKKTLAARMSDIASERRLELLRERYGITDTPNWKLKDAQLKIKADEVPQFIRRVTYRPFDHRWIYYNPVIIEKGDSKYPTLRHMLRSNVALLSARIQATGVFDAVFASKFLVEMKTAESSRSCTVFPLFLTGDADSRQAELPNDGVRPNLNPKILSSWAQKLGLKAKGNFSLPTGLTPEDIFHYAYAVFHSPGYRSRYAEFLKIDFPRLPLTGSLELFRVLARFGGELTALHLLESPKLAHPITEFIGGRNPEVERVSWSKDTVWLDKAQTTGFKGVREDVWNFHIGGYRVCHKWLKDRKGRTLSDEDIAHYQKIVVAIHGTIRLMAEIDEVIEQHGGWPGAFQAGEARAASAKVIPFRPRTVEPKPEERYVACAPLVPLKAAAGAFGDPQHIEDEGFEWVSVESRHRLRPGMFVAQVVGKSMEPAIPDGAWCLFRAPVEGTRQGNTVLVQLRNATDPETGQRYTVKRYESEKTTDRDSWRHARITLKPVNSDFDPIVLTGEDEGELQVVAELVEVLTGEVPDAEN
jgi:SOS-response transcriptional repressor LexA